MFKPECDMSLKFWNWWYHTSVVLCVNWLRLSFVNMSEYNWLKLGYSDVLFLKSFEHLCVRNPLSVCVLYKNSARTMH